MWEPLTTSARAEANNCMLCSATRTCYGLCCHDVPCFVGLSDVFRFHLEIFYEMLLLNRALFTCCRAASK